MSETDEETSRRDLGEIALRLLRELAEYDLTIAERMRELGLDEETKKAATAGPPERP